MKIVVSHCFCKLGAQKNSSNKATQLCRQYSVLLYNWDRLARNYTVCLGKRGQKKPYPAEANAEKCIVEGRWKSQLMINTFLSLLHRSLFIVIGSQTTTMPPTICHQKTTSGQCCSIPFTYKGVTYNSCTDVDHHRLWCSLDSQYKGHWENCCK